jgi:hypothetical protein
MISARTRPAGTMVSAGLVALGLIATATRIGSPSLL